MKKSGKDKPKHKEPSTSHKKPLPSHTSLHSHRLPLTLKHLNPKDKRFLQQLLTKLTTIAKDKELTALKLQKELVIKDSVIAQLKKQLEEVREEYRRSMGLVSYFRQQSSSSRVSWERDEGPLVKADVHGDLDQQSMWPHNSEERLPRKRTGYESTVLSESLLHDHPFKDDSRPESIQVENHPWPPSNYINPPTSFYNDGLVELVEEIESLMDIRLTTQTLSTPEQGEESWEELFQQSEALRKSLREGKEMLGGESGD